MKTNEKIGYYLVVIDIDDDTTVIQIHSITGEIMPVLTTDNKDDDETMNKFKEKSLGAVQKVQVSDIDI